MLPLQIPPSLRSFIILFALLGGSLQQLQVQIFQYDPSVSAAHGGQRNSSQQLAVVAEYTYPQGFSLDWYSTSYANIPPEGITGLLLYLPQPLKGECTAFNVSTLLIKDCSSKLNLSVLVLVKDNHTCLGRKISFAQEAGFSAMIIYSTGDEYLDLEDKVYDAATEQAIGIISSGLPLAVVSKAFGGTLLSSAVINNCSAEKMKQIHITVGSIDITAVRLGMSLLIICGGLLGLFIPFCSSLLFFKYFQRRSGSYNVHNYQMQELGSITPGEVHERTHNSPYLPKQQTFHLKDSNSSGTCPICLDLFADGEVVSALDCDRNHSFHPSCISRWLSKQSTCPVCRTFLHSNIQTNVT